MKLFTIIQFFILLFSLGLNAQVGINISQPTGVFYIDAGMNSPSVTTDDVTVNENGNLALGTPSATAKLHLNVPTGSTALRIVDGNQREDRVLLSDAAGNASWGTMPGSGGQQIQLMTAATYTSGVVTKFPLSSNTRYALTADGNYLVFIRFWGKTSAISASKLISGYLYLYKNGTEVDSLEHYEPVYNTSTYFSFSTALLAANCKKGDYLEIGLKPQTGNWTTATTAHTRCTITFFMM